MWLTALRGVLAHRLRLAATATAVLLGVALMAGTLVLTDTVTRTFDDLFGDVYKTTDVVVRGEVAFEGPQNLGAQRDRVAASLIEKVAAVPGVSIAEGSVLGYARIVGKDGDPLGNPAYGAPTLGYSWPEHAELNPFRLVTGRAPTASDEVVIDAKSARDGGLAVGDVTTVLVQGPARQFTIVGITRFGAADSPGGATVAAFEPATAQLLLAERGRYDEIAVVGSPGVAPAVLAQRVAAVLPAGTEAVTGAAVTAENSDAMHEALGFFTTFMLVFAGVALLVGAFMIFNTFTITVAQRTREHGLLRALGARRRQLLATVLAEAAVVGAVASVLGLGLGVAVAAGLKSLLSLLGMDIPAGGLVFAPRTVIVSLVVGFGVTVLAALVPARRAGSVSPMAALHTVESGDGEVPLRRIVAGLSVLGGGVACLLVGLLTAVPQQMLVVGFGVLAVFAGVTVLGPVLSPPLCRVLGRPVVRLRGTAGALARDNALRNPRRTAATASALMIGVGLVAFITVFVASTKASVNQVVQEGFTGDLVVDSGAGVTGGVSPHLAETLRALPEVAAASGLRLGAVQVNGKADIIGALEPADGFEILDAGLIAGNPLALKRDAIAVQEDEARELGVHVGDKVAVTFAKTGTQSMRVALIYRETQPAGRYLLGMPAYEANFPTSYDRQVFVKKQAGVDTAALLAAVNTASADYPGVDVLSRAEFVDRATGPMDQMLALVYVLLSLAIGIALLGIGNTLALSVHERVREIGLLRAVGMTRGQLRSSIRWESMIVAAQGTVLGLAVGIFFGWTLTLALADEGITVFRIPARQLTVIALVAALAGVVAGVLPARRAARLDVLRALGSH